MKKTLLTFVAVGMGVSVAFAQTTIPQEETQQTEQTTPVEENEEGKKKIEMYDLPVAVQDAFKNGQYKEYEVLAIYEVTPEAQATDMQGTEEGAVAQQTIMYEIELADATDDAYGNQEGVEEEGMEGIDTERVSAREPEIVLYYDAAGQLVKEEQPEEEDQY